MGTERDHSKEYVFWREERDALHENHEHITKHLGHLSIEEQNYSQLCKQDQELATKEYIEGLLAALNTVQENPSHDAYNLRRQTAQALLRGESLTSIFAGNEISAATEDFIAACLAEELRVADRPMVQQHPLLIDTLTAHFPMQQQHVKEILMEYSHPLQIAILRHYMGEPLDVIAEDMDISERTLRRQCAITKRKLSKYLGQGFEFFLKPSSVQTRASIFDELKDRIGELDEEVRLLNCRTNTQALRAIATEVSGTTTRHIISLLRQVNTPQAEKHWESKGSLLSQYRLVDHPWLALQPNPKVSRRIVMGADPELDDMLTRVQSTRGKLPLQTQQERRDLLKKIEAGVWAEIHCALMDANNRLYVAPNMSHYLVDRSMDKDLLDIIISQGKEALQELVMGNKGLALFLARKEQRAMRNDISIGEWYRIGLMAMVHAIQKADYKRDAPFNSTFVEWYVKSYVQNTLAEDLGITRYQWHHVGSLFKRRRILKRELQRDPTDEELRQSLGWGEQRFETIQEIIETVIEPRQKREVPIGEFSPATDKRASESSATSAPISFGEEVLLALKRVLGKNDVGAKILHIHFAMGYDLDEIAETIGISQKEVSRCHATALQTIKDALLNKDMSADNSNLFDLLAEFF